LFEFEKKSEPEKMKKNPAKKPTKSPSRIALLAAEWAEAHIPPRVRAQARVRVGRYIGIAWLTKRLVKAHVNFTLIAYH
jgi:hypothetical protein